MTKHPAQALIDLKPTKDFLIGIDSDGCAFDSMEIKQKECFTPNTIKFFGLQAISKVAREACEFVNLYSRWRGVNRFPAVLKTLDLLAERGEVAARGFELPAMEAMREWVDAEAKPANPALKTAIEASSGATRTELELVLAWSEAVNETVADIVHGVPPFPYVREFLTEASVNADQIVVSATPNEALEREWKEHGIASHVSVIAGQEMGKKAEHLQLATDGKYEKDRVLMIGDAPGDMNAAKANDVLFYPIRPGDEEASWKRLREEYLALFLAGDYRGSCQDRLIDEFLAGLPETPPWSK